jgi:anti-anti-sigma regulatory factor
MKLALRQEDTVSILEVSGTVDAKNFAILKAGITKLLRDGKNRIVLSLVDASQLEGEVLRELAIIDVYARELSGKIILASSNEELKESVRAFAKPPVVPILASVELALDYFKKSQPSVEEEEDLGALKTKIAEKEKVIAALEARIKLQDPREAKDLRSANAELKEKVALLEKQVNTLTKEKRKPMDEEGFLEKILTLEDTVKRLSAAEKK